MCRSSYALPSHYFLGAIAAGLLLGSGICHAQTIRGGGFGGSGISGGISGISGGLSGGISGGLSGGLSGGIGGLSVAPARAVAASWVLQPPGLTARS